MFQVELIRVSLDTVGEFSCTARALTVPACYCYFRKYSTEGVVTDQDGNVYTPDSEQFKSMKMLSDFIQMDKEDSEKAKKALEKVTKPKKATKKVSKTSKK